MVNGHVFLPPSTVEMGCAETNHCVTRMAPKLSASNANCCLLAEKNGDARTHSTHRRTTRRTTTTTPLARAFVKPVLRQRKKCVIFHHDYSLASLLSGRGLWAGHGDGTGRGRGRGSIVSLCDLSLSQSPFSFWRVTDCLHLVGQRLAIPTKSSVV